VLVQVNALRAQVPQQQQQHPNQTTVHPRLDNTWFLLRYRWDDGPRGETYIFFRSDNWFFCSENPWTSFEGAWGVWFWTRGKEEGEHRVVFTFCRQGFVPSYSCVYDATVTVDKVGLKFSGSQWLSHTAGRRQGTHSATEVR
jgi:hypothetical protein